MEKEIFESSLETARKRANIRRVEDLKKKKNVSQPDTPKRVFQKRICVLIMSLVQTVEQRDAKGVRGKLVTLITVEPSPLSLSLSLCFSASLVLPSLPLLSQTRFLSSSSSLSLIHIFFFISHSRLCLTSVAEFFRSTAIITPRRWKRKTGVENSEWCKGVVTATTRGEKRFEEIVWKFLDNSVGGTPYAIFRLAFFLLSLKGCFRYIQPFHPLLILSFNKNSEWSNFQILFHFILND